MVTVTNKDLQILNEFLENRSVSYVLTGTAALFYHGALPEGTEVHDIDIIVLTTDETRPALQAMFKELETLSGCRYENEYYEQQVYIFKVGKNNVRINAFEDHPGNVQYETMIIDGNPIKVSPVMAILKAKFALKRQKDFDFYLRLIQQLSSMFLSCLKK